MIVETHVVLIFPYELLCNPPNCTIIYTNGTIDNTAGIASRVFDDRNNHTPIDLISSSILYETNKTDERKINAFRRAKTQVYGRGCSQVKVLTHISSHKLALTN